MSRLILLVAMFAAFADEGQARKRFERPKIERQERKLRLDWCLHWETDCGGPAANAFCKGEGFESAASFEIDPAIGSARAPTAIIGDDDVLCPGKSPGHVCDGFKNIVCEKMKEAKPFLPVGRPQNPTFEDIQK